MDRSPSREPDPWLEALLDREADPLPCSPRRMLRLQSIDPDENRWRAYEIDLQPTLFGDVAVATRWGRIGTGGQERIYHFSSRKEALQKVRRLIRRRRQHGYELVDGGRSLQLVEAEDR